MNNCIQGSLYEVTVSSLFFIPPISYVPSEKPERTDQYKSRQQKFAHRNVQVCVYLYGVCVCFPPVYKSLLCWWSYNYISYNSLLAKSVYSIAWVI